MIKVGFIEPEQFYLVDKYCEEQKLPRIDSNWAKVVAGIDTETGKVVGIISSQLVLHAEPISIDPEHRGNGLWREMCEMMHGYLQQMANVGVVTGIYTQPVHDEARAICEKMGFHECEHPLWVKVYKPGE